MLFLVLMFDSLGLTADDFMPIGVDFAESYYKFCAPGFAAAVVNTLFIFIISIYSHFEKMPSFPIKKSPIFAGGYLFSMSFKFFKFSA